MNIPQLLIDVGLESKEARIYTWLLRQPRSMAQTAFSISKGVGMPRSTVYVILESLEEKKLVSSYKKDNVLHYLTANPSRLQKNFEEKQEVLKDLIPSLESLAKDAAFSPSVRTFTGTKGVKTVFDEIYDNPKANGVHGYNTISNPILLKYLGKEFPKYMELKRKYSMFSHVIFPHSFSINTPKEYLPDSHRDTRYLPEGFIFEGSVIVYGKKVAVFSHRDNEMYSMIIDSPTISEMFNAIFNCLWNLLPASTNQPTVRVGRTTK